MARLSLQEEFASLGVCFGCGPANKRGLRIKSFVEGESIVANWTPKPYHHAFGNFLNGGVISTILDCHSNWAAAYSLMRSSGTRTPPPTVTASISVRFLRPTPIGPLALEAKTRAISGSRAVIETTLKAKGETTATLEGTFVAVGPDHPAADRWAGGRRRVPSRVGTSGS